MHHGRNTALKKWEDRMANVVLAVGRLWSWRLNRVADDGGSSLVEYVLMVSLIALVCLAAVTSFGASNGGSINSSASRIVAAGG